MIRLTVLGSCGTYPGPGRACSGYLFEAPVSEGDVVAILPAVAGG